jgi:hypothetical protein
MLSKALIFVFTSFGVFAILLGTMPSEFITQTFNPKYVDPEVREKFEAVDVMMYDNVGNDNMTYPYSSLEDGPAPPDWEAGLPSGQYLEVWWSEDSYVKTLEARHATAAWWGWNSVILWPKYANGSWVTVGGGKWLGIWRDHIVSAWDEEKNCSAFYFVGPVTTSILFFPTNQSKTIGEAWDEGKISYYLSYQVNWNATGLSAWNIVGQLISFQIPDLGVPGVGGTILSMVIAFPFWSLIAYLVYKIVAGVIPLVSGGAGD